MTDRRTRAAVHRASEAAISAIVADDDRYPAGGAFIAEDHPAFDALVAGYVHEGKPFVVVARDGAETLYTPTHA